MTDGYRQSPVRERVRSQEGAINVVSAIVLVVVLVAAAITAWLLGRTLNAAQNINGKAETIARTGQGINTATDSVVQLNRTNQTASSILQSAGPLDEKLATIVSLAKEVNGLAVSINGTAGTINNTAGTINGTAGKINSTAGQINTTAGQINTTASGINAQAAAILDVAKRIDNDVFQINDRLDGTIALAQAIKGDTGTILGEAGSAHHNAACIDNKVGAEPPDGHCAGS